MSVFAKNVENVQGDERDIIVFSSTFGRNSQGSFRRNFVVLGQTDGERRLNVAVTRARRKVVMITSMPIADISDMLTTQRPPASPRDYLQGYLEYARALSSGEFACGHNLLQRLVTERQDARARPTAHSPQPTATVSPRRWRRSSVPWAGARSAPTKGMPSAWTLPSSTPIPGSTPWASNATPRATGCRPAPGRSGARRCCAGPFPTCTESRPRPGNRPPHSERARLQAAIKQALQPLAGSAAPTPPQTLADTEQTP